MTLRKPHNLGSQDYSEPVTNYRLANRPLLALRSSTLPPSVNQSPLLALSLLRLLSQNRIAEFHTLLETLPSAVTASTEVVWVLQLERSLMEGAYSRVWRLCQGTAAHLPRSEFGLFVTALVDTVRNEIAACDERAYASLPLADARTLLFFDTEAEVRQFAALVSSKLWLGGGDGDGDGDGDGVERATVADCLGILFSLAAWLAY